MSADNPTDVLGFRSQFPDIPLFGDPPHIPAALFTNKNNDSLWKDLLELKTWFQVGYNGDILKFAFDHQNPIASVNAIMSVLERRKQQDRIPFLILKAVELYPETIIEWVKKEHSDLAKWFSDPMSKFPRALNNEGITNQWWANIDTKITAFPGWKTWINTIEIEDYKALLQKQLQKLLSAQKISTIYRKQGYPLNIVNWEEFHNTQAIKSWIINIYKQLPEDTKNMHAHAMLIFGEMFHNELPYPEEFYAAICPAFHPNEHYVNPTNFRITPTFRDQWLDSTWYRHLFTQFTAYIAKHPDFLDNLPHSSELCENYKLSAYITLYNILNDPSNANNQSPIRYSQYAEVMTISTPEQCAVINQHLKHWIHDTEKTTFIVKGLIPADVQWAAACIHSSPSKNPEVMHAMDTKWSVFNDIQTIYTAQVLQHLEPTITPDTVTMLMSKQSTMNSLDPYWSWEETLNSWLQPQAVNAVELDLPGEW